MKRCTWKGIEKPHYERYHDQEWGIPVFDDQKLFEMLILEGAQAGLSWENILRRRENYRAAFFNFDAQKVALMSDAQLHSLLNDTGLIRNRLKIFSVRQNARVFLIIQKECASFSNYIWSYVKGKSIINYPKKLEEINIETKVSQALSKDLKKRGMSFVGPTIIYAFMQAIGMVDDHLIDCFRAEEKLKLRKKSATLKQ